MYGLRGEKEKQHDNRQQESVIQSVTSERKKKKGSVDLLLGTSHRDATQCGAKRVIVCVAMLIRVFEPSPLCQNVAND